MLNELDKWVESQWQNHPLVKEYGYERKIRNSITFDGMDVSSEEYRAELGYLPQDFGYYPRCV